MDKYTVDLDKVLNDFEYSELTDQYGAEVTSYVNNFQEQQQSSRSTPLKHTINNVFQSLNDYLNTDIGVKNTKHDIAGCIEPEPNSLFQNQTPTVSFQQQFSYVELKGEASSPIDEVPLLINEAPSIINEVSIIKEVPLPIDVVSMVVEENILNLQESYEAPTPQIVVEQIENLIDAPAPLMLDSSNLSCEKSDVSDFMDKTPEDISYETLQEESVSEECEKQEESEKDCVSNEMCLKEESNLDLQSEIVEAEIREQEKEDFQSQLPAAPQVLSFDNFAVNVDDSELNKYLEELENDEEINKPVIEKEIVEVCKNSEQILVSEAVVTVSEPIVAMCEPTVTVCEPTVTVCEPTVAADNSLVTVHEPIITVSLPEDNIPPETHESVEDNVADRPSTLQISSTQIDLVGEPGSTPYNNLYITKTLPKQQEVPIESDIDSCESTSPTFSTASTASAESIVGAVNVEENAQGNAPAEISQTADNSLDAAVNDFSSGATEEVIERSIPVCEATIDSSQNAISHHDSFDERQDDDDLTNLMGALKNEIRAEPDLGKTAPVWIPDSDSLNCLHCDTKFTMMKRRHHCRACGYVLCSKCCNKKFKLKYLEAEARVCLRCYEVLNLDSNAGSSGSEVSSSVGNSPSRSNFQPNPNNPMDYCSKIPPHQQVSASALAQPPSVMVPVGVLKRQGSSKMRTNKSVMFCDGIRPGSELTDLDNDFSYQPKSSASGGHSSKKGASPPPTKVKKNAPLVDPVTNSYIPNGENNLPPTVTIVKADMTFTECTNDLNLMETLKAQPLTFALQNNLHVHVQIVNMDCCINKWAWCFSSEGMITVGQDEIVYIIEFIEEEKVLPRDIFIHFANVYNDAKKGSSITESSISIHETPNFLDSKNHIGFLYIRPTFQCLQHVIIPKEPYLIGILIHRWEMPWAKIFPLRLVLRLGAEYRYYPSPIISSRHRESVFVEIGHTIINLLADFRNFTYTLPNIRGLTIHMEDKNTTVEIPSNRYDQVVKSLNNSSDHILAFGGNFSVKADSHLVCIQDTQGNNENTYTTHAINIHNRPRKVTGASFIVFNGALKSTSGLTAKSSIIEDGLMIQIPPEHMIQIRESLRNMKNYTIQCGCVNATTDETVNIVWVDNDINFNMGVQSSIDGRSLAGIPSIRVHNGKDFICSSGNRMIRWTEVFILQNGDKLKGQEVDCSKLAESVSKATCQALVKYLDLLSSNNFNKIGLRATLHVENVSYAAGSNGTKLPPIYMKSLDDELVPVLHRITTNNLGENMVILELVFRILNL